MLLGRWYVTKNATSQRADVYFGTEGVLVTF